MNGLTVVLLLLVWGSAGDLRQDDVCVLLL